jgi:excisionase family DNA binding protein
VNRIALSITETAVALGVSNDHIERLVHAGELRVARIGQRTGRSRPRMARIPLAEIDRFLAESTAP